MSDKPPRIPRIVPVIRRKVSATPKPETVPLPESVPVPAPVPVHVPVPLAVSESSTSTSSTSQTQNSSLSPKSARTTVSNTPIRPRLPIRAPITNNNLRQTIRPKLCPTITRTRIHNNLESVVHSKQPVRRAIGPIHSESSCRITSQERYILALARKIGYDLRNWHLPPRREHRKILSPLEELRLLLQGKCKNQRLQTDWEYLISIFTDLAKSQKKEILDILEQRVTLSGDPSDNMILTLPYLGSIRTHPRNLTNNKITLPSTFLRIESIPILTLSTQNNETIFIRMTIDQLIEIEKQKKDNDKDLLEIYRLIKLHLPSV